MVEINEYERIVRKFSVPLFKYCYYRLKGDIELTEETVDDIFHLLYRKWDTLDTDGNVRAWLYRVADREIMSHRKRAGRYYEHNESLDQAIDDGKTDNLRHYDEYFADHTPEEEHMARVREALPEEFRKIFSLRFMEKRTLDDTAAELGIPYSTLRLRISKLERLIKAEIKNIFNN